MKRILALLVVVFLPVLVLSSCSNAQSKEPILRSLIISLYEADAPISQSASFQSTEEFDVEFDYPEGSLLSAFIAVTDGNIPLYDGPQPEMKEAAFSLSLDAGTCFPYGVPSEQPTDDPARYTCDELDWELPVSSISGLPVTSFSSHHYDDQQTGGRGVSVLITATDVGAGMTIQALVYLDKGGSIDDLKKMVNDFVKTLYIDFEQWREINQTRSVQQ